MTPEEKAHFEEILVKAVQAGKQETSGLVDMIMHKLEKGIEESINKNVNGKIKNMSDKFDDYVIMDNQWKDGVSPSIEIMKKIQNSSSVIRWIAQTIILLGALVGGIAFLISKLK